MVEAEPLANADAYGNSQFFGSTELLGTLQARSPAAFNSTVEIDGSLLAHGRATFESPATFTGSVFLPALTYLNGSLLEPVKIAITGCTASDSWLVETDNTGSEFQVQATAALDPITVGSAVCNVSPKFTSPSAIDDSTNAFDKNASTSWTPYATNTEAVTE
ncbi:hypothetical protein T492DRAFT_861893 [Pavlovales sp. CCMP2436]|nr:hypothetical protein T492DRAFT_861893 [Pavlovales sp. CCMP2436]